MDVTDIVRRNPIKRFDKLRIIEAKDLPALEHSMLGHYSAGFTLDTYTHVTHQMQQGGG